MVKNFLFTFYDNVFFVYIQKLEKHFLFTFIFFNISNILITFDHFLYKKTVYKKITLKTPIGEIWAQYKIYF